MEFRPCIDIHNGKIKQIVGGSLSDQKDQAQENFISEKDGTYYGGLYREKNLNGGHIILLNPATSPFFEENKRQALMALSAFPGGLQIGGGITEENAEFYLQKGASHVIVTSYVFRDGLIDWERLRSLSKKIGKEHLVLDLSCRKKENDYYIVTDRWQKFTETKVNKSLLKELSAFCDEFLVHAVDVEGKNQGIEEELIGILVEETTIPMTYAGGIHSYADVETIKKLGNNKLNFTIGSSLDLFGGELSLEKVVEIAEKD